MWAIVEVSLNFYVLLSFTVVVLLLIRLPFESSSGRDGDDEVDEVDDSGDQAEAAHREGSVVIPGIV